MVTNHSLYRCYIHQRHQLLDTKMPHNDINNNSKTPQEAKQKIAGRHTVTKAITSTNIWKYFNLLQSLSVSMSKVHLMKLS